jgi:hypothetical protein
MKGAVAAGHPLTAQTGAEILAGGGNAVDACIAACVRLLGGREPADAGPGRAVFMPRATARQTTPGTRPPLDLLRIRSPGARGPSGGWTGTDGGGSTCEFRARMQAGLSHRCGSCAVPGSDGGARGGTRGPMAGSPLARAHRARARGSPTRGPRRQHASRDFPAHPSTPILRARAGGQAESTEARRRCQPGETVRMRLSRTNALTGLAAEGPEAICRGRQAVTKRLQHGRAGTWGARFSATDPDLESYRGVSPPAARGGCRTAGGNSRSSNPPPSAGGLLSAYGAERARPARVRQASQEGDAGDRGRSPKSAGGPAGTRCLAFTAASVGGRCLPRRLVTEENSPPRARRAGRAAGAASLRRAGRGHPSTTHISVVDARGTQLHSRPPPVRLRRDRARNRDPMNNMLGRRT